MDLLLLDSRSTALRNCPGVGPLHWLCRNLRVLLFVCPMLLRYTWGLIDRSVGFRRIQTVY